MRARVWGCRGSLAAPGGETLRYGGNTACVEVRLEDGTLIILDAGTGIRPLGVQLESHPPPTVHLLLSHLHLDHLQGLAFFPPLWDRDGEFHIWGPSSPSGLRAGIERYFSPPLFPVRLRDLPARIHFRQAPRQPWHVGAARIVAEPVTHQGPTLGYRIEEEGSSLAYLPDHEPARGRDLLTAPPHSISGYRVAQGADILLHDAQYTDHEYAKRDGWGHSTVAHATLFARIAQANRLVLFHHDPLHSDRQLEALLARSRELWGASETPPDLAHEGMVFDLSSRRPRSSHRIWSEERTGAHHERGHETAVRRRRRGLLATRRGSSPGTAPQNAR
ncbi:MAG: MBL fold metallo-hydrolase [Nitriliruptorales bacterium]